MAREKPLDLKIVQEWLAAWDEAELFSEEAVRHLQSLIADPHCLVVITRGVGCECRSLVFRRWKWAFPTRPDRADLSPPLASDLGKIPSMYSGAVPPLAPKIGQLWHRTGVRPERILEWDGVEWIIAAPVCDDPVIMKQGLQPCDFQEALAFAHEHAERDTCELFIYTCDDSTWGSA